MRELPFEKEGAPVNDEQALERAAPRRGWLALLFGSPTRVISLGRTTELNDERQTFRLTEGLRVGETMFSAWVGNSSTTHTALLTVVGGNDTQAHLLAPGPRLGERSGLVHLPRTLVEVQLDITGDPEPESVRLRVREVGVFEALLRRLLWSLRRLRGAPERLPTIFSRAWEVLATQGLRGLLHALRTQAPQRQRNYVDWINAFDRITERDRLEIRGRIDRLQTAPTFSIVLKISGSADVLAMRTIESIRRQLYPHWVLCVMQHAPSHEDLGSLLALDSRIRVATVAAVTAGGNTDGIDTIEQWVAFLDAGDELSERALFECAFAAGKMPTAKVIYSDEDLVEAGVRSSPRLKPNWSPERERSTHYLGQLTVYRRDLIERLSDEADITAADLGPHELALRCTDGLMAEEVVHLPAILAHRAGPGSIGSTERSGLTHLVATNGISTSSQRAPGPARLRVHEFPPGGGPLVSVIIPTRDRRELLQQCIESIRIKTTYDRYEVIVVDNGTREPDALEYLRELATDGVARVIQYDGPFNFSAINNYAVDRARGDVLCLLNNDVEVQSPGWLSEMVALALQPGVGAVGAKLYYPNGTIQHAGVVLGLHGLVGHIYRHVSAKASVDILDLNLVREVAAVTAACLVVRTALFRTSGGLEDQHLKVAFNDVDFCLRLLEQGLRNLWTPHAELIHHESASRGSDAKRKRRGRAAEEALWFKSRWGRYILSDPYFNPNLSLFSDIPTLAWPPRKLSLVPGSLTSDRPD